MATSVIVFVHRLVWLGEAVQSSVHVPVPRRTSVGRRLVACACRQTEPSVRPSVPVPSFERGFRVCESLPSVVWDSHSAALAVCLGTSPNLPGPLHPRPQTGVAPPPVAGADERTARFRTVLTAGCGKGSRWRETQGDGSFARGVVTPVPGQRRGTARPSGGGAGSGSPQR